MKIENHKKATVVIEQIQRIKEQLESIKYIEEHKFDLRSEHTLGVKFLSKLQNSVYIIVPDKFLTKILKDLKKVRSEELKRWQIELEKL